MNTTLHTAAVSAIVESGKAAARHESFGAVLASAISALFADVAGNDKEFIAEFGNGRPPKAKDFVAGKLAEDVRAKLKGKSKAEQESIANTLKSRLTEVRKLHKLEGMPQKDESIRNAIKRYEKPAPKDDKGAAAPAGKAMTLEEFAASATVAEIADLVTLWTARHGNAAVGLAKALTDTLPISVRRAKSA